MCYNKNKYYTICRCIFFSFSFCIGIRRLRHLLFVCVCVCVGGGGVSIHLKKMLLTIRCVKTIKPEILLGGKLGFGRILHIA